MANKADSPGFDGVKMGMDQIDCGQYGMDPEG